MIDPTELNRRIKEILTLCDRVNRLFGEYSSKAFRDTEQAFLNAIFSLDADAGDLGVHPGRFIKLPVQTGYAWYIVLRVGKKTARLVHIPYGEALKSPQLISDSEEIFLNTLQEVIGFEDGRKCAVARTGRGG